MIKLINGDCLEALKNIEDKSVNLILIDPPYNIKKAKWDSWKTVEAYVEFMGKVFKELERVLKDNGSFYFFHNDFLQVAELQCWIRQNTKFVFKSFITINKLDNNYVKDLYGNCEHFRNYLNFNEYALFYTFADGTGLKKIMLDMNNFKELRSYFEQIQNSLGVTKKIIIDEVGQCADHCFRWGSSQWDLPTEKTYNKLIDIFKIDKLDFFKPYEQLKTEYEAKRLEYEADRYTFNETQGKETVWAYKFREEKKTIHPTQKPVKLLEDIIKASSNENDIVLDCFMGSGSCGVAAVNTNRHFIGIELDKNYFEIAEKRIEEAKNEVN